MLTQTRRSVRLRAPFPFSRPTRRSLGLGDVMGRLIQITLALYLVPVLLVVLVISGAGMVVLAAARLFTTPIRKPVG